MTATTAVTTSTKDFGKFAAPVTGEDNSKHGGGIGCCGVGTLLLIIGGICYAVGKHSCETEGLKCDENLRFGGEVTMYVGAGLVGASLLCVAAICCCVGGAALAGAK